MPKPTARHYEAALEEIETTAKALRDRWVADLEAFDDTRARLNDNVSHPDYPGRTDRARILAGIEEQNKTIATMDMVRVLAEAAAEKGPKK